MDKRVTTIDGVAVEYAVAGNGAPAIVLLTGAAGPIEGWYRVLAPLEACSTVVAYNRLGIGRSSKPSEPQTGDVVVRLLHALLESLRSAPSPCSRRPLSRRLVRQPVRPAVPG